MATTLALGYVTLIDNFPGTVDRRAEDPKDFFKTTSPSFNKSTAIYTPGTKRQIWDETAGGPITLCYMRNKTLGTGPAAAAAGSILHPHTTQWELSTDPDDTPAYSLAKGQVAIALGAVTLEYYAWFWIGGPCPQDTTKYFSTSLSTVTVTTDDSVVLTAALMPYDATAKLGLKVFTGDVIACGNSTAAD